jgi:preprotein translocase subunit YajC
MYFFMIRPQKKRQKEIQNFRNSLTVGSKIVTAGGIYGTVKDLNLGEAYITIEISNGVKIQIDRNYVYADPSQAQQQ